MYTYSDPITMVRADAGPNTSAQSKESPPKKGTARIMAQGRDPRGQSNFGHHARSGCERRAITVTDRDTLVSTSIAEATGLITPWPDTECADIRSGSSGRRSGSADVEPRKAVND